MPRTVKLTSADARAWRENRAQWVSPKGFVLRAVTPEEEKAVFPALEQVKRFKQSGTCDVAAVYKTADANTGAIREQQVPMQVVVRVTKTGRSAEAYLYDLFVNGNRYVKGRDVLRARILEKHGEAILQGPNGKQMCVLRDPTVNRPTFAESQRSAPSPERCHCKGFKDNPDIGRHHMACEWNMKAAPHERALPLQRDGIQRGMMELSTPIASMHFQAPDGSRTPSMPTTPVLRTVNGVALHAQSGSAIQHGGVASMAVPQVINGPGYSGPQSSGPVAPPGEEETFGRQSNGAQLRTAPQGSNGVSVAHTPSSVAVRGSVQGPPLVSPKDCENDCRGLSSGTNGWAWPNGRKPSPNEHHPLCKNAAAWLGHVSGQKKWMLYDMDRHLELREATADERAKAEVELARSGIRSVPVGDGLYAVVEAGTSPLAAVARGTSLVGSRMRTTPDQEALRSSDGPAPRVTNRPAAPPSPPAPPSNEAELPKPASEMSIEELEAMILARRRESAPIEDLGMTDEVEEHPNHVPDLEMQGEPSWGEMTEEAVSGQPSAVSSGYYPEPGAGRAGSSTTSESEGVLNREPSFPSPSLPPGAYLAGELPGLRNELGLVGLQQKPSTIETGPVRVVDPEPFVDPLEPVGPEVRFSPQV